MIPSQSNPGAPSLREAQYYFDKQSCYTCSAYSGLPGPYGTLQTSSITNKNCRALCTKCNISTSAPSSTILGLGSTELVRVSKDNKIFYKEREIKQWKASPDPGTSTPRMVLTLSDGATCYITGQDAGHVWKAIRGQQYAGQKVESIGYPVPVRASKNAIIQGNAADSFSIIKKKDPMFEKLKKFVPGTVIKLAKRAVKPSQGVQEHQSFLVRKLDEENCAVFLSPVYHGRVAEITSKFTATEISKFTVVPSPELSEPLPQVDQVLPKGPFVTVQGYYEQWE